MIFNRNQLICVHYTSNTNVMKIDKIVFLIIYIISYLDFPEMNNLSFYDIIIIHEVNDS